jgi:hypothetical protein
MSTTDSAALMESAGFLLQPVWEMHSGAGVYQAWVRTDSSVRVTFESYDRATYYTFFFEKRADLCNWAARVRREDPAFD